MSTYYLIEEFIPAESSLSGAPYWTRLTSDYPDIPYKTKDIDEAVGDFRLLKKAGRHVRIVKVIEEVVA